jgi:ankyrin repeat protein
MQTELRFDASDDRDVQGNTCLHFAAAYGTAAATTPFLCLSARLRRAFCESGHVAIIELLLSLDTPPSLLVFNDDGFAAIHLAVLRAAPHPATSHLRFYLFTMDGSCVETQL